jgi:hypothetical protein
VKKDELNIPFVSVRQSRAPHHPDFHHHRTYNSLHLASPSSNLNIYNRGQILLVVLGLHQAYVILIDMQGGVPRVPHGSGLDLRLGSALNGGSKEDMVAWRSNCGSAERPSSSHSPLVSYIHLSTIVIHLDFLPSFPCTVDCRVTKWLEALLFLELSTLFHPIPSLCLYSASLSWLFGLSNPITSFVTSQGPLPLRFRIFRAYHGFCPTERMTYTSICTDIMENWFASDRIWSRLATRPRSQISTASLQSSQR